MQQYLEALSFIKNTGRVKEDRTGVGTTSVFGYQMRFDLQKGFPAVTTKRLAWKAVVAELLWFLEGSTDERRLAEIQHGSRDISKNTIWSANANSQAKDLGYENSKVVKQLGPIYGYQWRHYGGDSWAGGNNTGTDQIRDLVTELITNPKSRRLILSAWNPNHTKQMTLPPCHVLSQFEVHQGVLNCQLYQRSADMFLGVPFNIASYSLLTHMLAQIVGLKAGEFVWTGGDCHIYNNHFEQVEEQLSRKPKSKPTLQIPKAYTIQQFIESDVSEYKLVNYEPMNTIKAPMAV